MDEKTKLELISEGEIRTRYSPAPTGPLHLGSARTALFNFLFAKKHGGSFILRIEDTDPVRSQKKYEKNIILSLKWLKILWDEGPDIGGPYGPYRQSERTEIYSKYLKKLLEERKAYYCFCTPEELKSERDYQLSKGLPPKYSRKCFNLPEKEVKKLLKLGKRAVIRLYVPENKKIEFIDRIRGRVVFDSSLIGDFVIAKGLSFPLYNFACAVDDYEMKISHVIRGEDLLSSTPRQILIQKMLNFRTPEYAHLPLIFGESRAKLSKRYNAKSIIEYKREGYLSEAILNFIALLGWNPGDEREIFYLNSLIKEFSLERVQKSPAILNPSRLDFLNGFYIRHKPIDELTELCLPYLIKDNLIEPPFDLKEKEVSFFGKDVNKYLIKETKEEIPIEKIKKIIALYQERLKNLQEISKLTDFFFKEKLEYDKSLLKWKDIDDQNLDRLLDFLIEILSKIDEEDWNKDNLQKILVSEAENFAQSINKNKDRGYLLWALRVALTGKRESAPPFEIGEILGKEKTIKRIKEAKEKK